jgi:hypothetical protein
MWIVGLVVAVAAACAIPARATRGAQVTADEPQYLLTADALARTGDLDIGPGLRAQTWRSYHRDVALPRQTAYRPGGQRLSPHDPLLPVILAVPMRVGGWAAAKATLAVLAGVLASLLTWTAVRRFAVPLAVAAPVVAGFGIVPPLVSYGTQIYPELPAALAVTVAIAAITGPVRTRTTAAWVLAVLALPWLAVKYAPVAAALALVGLMGLARIRAWRPAFTAAAVLALGGIAFLVFHQRVYGGPTVYAAGNHFAGGDLEVMGNDPDHLSRTGRLVGLLTDRDFGLLAWAPAYLAAVPALAVLVRRRPDGWAALALPWAAGWANATWIALTMHGWWWPGRQVVVVLPTLVLAVAWWVARVGSWATWRRWFAGAVAFGALAWGWLLVEVALGQRTVIVDFAQTSNPISRVWRKALPDLRRAGGLDTGLQVGWVVVLALLAAWAWRSGGDEDAGAREGADADVATVDLHRGGAVGR